MRNTLDLFLASKKKSYKYKKYFSVYDEMFSIYKDKKITFVEIGVLDGGSLEMWKNFFGDKARIIGIDLNPECKKFESNGIEIFIGDQGDKNFWKHFFDKVGKVDIILDDGSHRNEHQILTTLYTIPNIKNGGLLAFEDTITSYWRKYGNPHKYSFINFTKKLIDDLNFTHPGENSFKISLNKFVYSIRYFENFCIFYIDKRRCIFNERIENSGTKYENENFVNKKSKIKKFSKKISKLFPFLKKIRLVTNFYQLIIYISLKLKNYSLKSFFK